MAARHILSTTRGERAMTKVEPKYFGEENIAGHLRYLGTYTPTHDSDTPNVVQITRSACRKAADVLDCLVPAPQVAVINDLVAALKVARQLLTDNDIDEDGPTPEIIQIDNAIAAVDGVAA
jgi:hypothetical protein